jgi:transposase InsO family protein
VSTIASVLKNKDLAVKRRRRPHTPIQTPPYVIPHEPNAVWCADYKGHFRAGDGTRIDPLTITDGSSRYLLRCQIVERTDFTHAQAVFEAAFREFGMPGVIHTDNGVPFASVAPGGLSPLSIWFVKLGITPERSRPGSPQDNGRHERMHRTYLAGSVLVACDFFKGEGADFGNAGRRYNGPTPRTTALRAGLR